MKFGDIEQVVENNEEWGIPVCWNIWVLKLGIDNYWVNIDLRKINNVNNRLAYELNFGEKVILNLIHENKNSYIEYIVEPPLIIKNSLPFPILLKQIV